MLLLFLFLILILSRRMLAVDLGKRRSRANLMLTLFYTALLVKFDQYNPLFSKLRDLWHEVLPCTVAYDEVIFMFPLVLDALFFFFFPLWTQLSRISPQILQELTEPTGDQTFRLVELVTNCASVTGMDGPSLPPPLLASDPYTRACRILSCVAM